MLKRMTVVVLAIFLVIGSVATVAAQSAPPAPPAAAPVAGQNLLIATHLAAGLQCSSCHQENPPASPVQTATCLTCHGPYESLAAKTAADDPNPHASHLGNLPCEACHHMHKPSVSYCDQCHSYPFTVP